MSSELEDKLRASVEFVLLNKMLRERLLRVGGIDMGEFVVKDSGLREHFDSGMQRDTQDGKARFDLVFDGPMLARCANHLMRGAVKYSPRNWMQASSQEEADRFRASAARHFAQWMRGDADEDHAAAVFFNINGYEYVRERLDAAKVR